ncbi:hypothetical protein CTI12_AA540520 [Artemisia annua]|uniref:DUF4283 domain-containing protein n=1 Tax=Artemisia annua TaxID=35608 RepID=A0A2U1L1N9_ARTAN|nr:hypothetical protein CTI12_AA540520 [Artemisia annua]
MSGIGKPMVMDKMTKERCLKKAGKLDFARVLVEVKGVEDLPNVIEISYPALGNRPAKVGKLEVKYQWRPPLCTHCKTFGHTTMACKVRPRSQEEIDGKKPVLDKNEGENSKSNAKVLLTVMMVSLLWGSVQKKYMPKQVPNSSVTNNGRGGMQNEGNAGGNSKFQSKAKWNNGVQRNSNKDGGVQGNKINPKSKSMSKVDNKEPLVAKSLQQLSKDPNYKLKVLVRGSSSKSNSESLAKEAIPISNSFDLLKDDIMEQGNDCGEINVQQEFDDKVWHDLKFEVDVLMEAGIYPSKAVRMDWTLHQMDYFYKIFHKYHLAFEDEDVEFQMEGIASDMKPEFDTCAADVNGKKDKVFFMISSADHWKEWVFCCILRVVYFGLFLLMEVYYWIVVGSGGQWNKSAELIWFNGTAINTYHNGLVGHYVCKGNMVGFYSIRCNGLMEVLSSGCSLPLMIVVGLMECVLTLHGLLHWGWYYDVQDETKVNVDMGHRGLKWCSSRVT